MSTNEILPIVVFSVFFGVALTATGERGRPIVRGVEALVAVMLQLTNYVMRFAPFAVFTAVSSALAERGPQIIMTLGKFVGSFYLGLIILWALLIGAAFLIVGSRTRHLVRYIRDPVVLARDQGDRRRRCRRQDEGCAGRDGGAEERWHGAGS